MTNTPHTPHPVSHSTARPTGGPAALAAPLAIALTLAFALLLGLTPTAAATPLLAATTALPAAPARAAADPQLTVVQPLTLTTLTPETGRPVTATFAVRNDGPTAVTLIQIGAGGRGPSCTDFQCGDVINFDLAQNITIAPGETYTYADAHVFLTAGPHFFSIVYEETAADWRFIGSRVDVTLTPGLTLTTPLLLTPANPARNAVVTATFALANLGATPVTLARLVVGARGPDCVPATVDCTLRPDHPAVDNLTLAPGETYTYTATRTYTENGRYFVGVFFISELDEWESIGPRLNFMVSEIGGVGAENLFLPLIQP
jgi:hypothetical protein